VGTAAEGGRARKEGRKRRKEASAFFGRGKKSRRDAPEVGVERGKRATSSRLMAKTRGVLEQKILRASAKKRGILLRRESKGGGKH